MKTEVAPDMAKTGGVRELKRETWDLEAAKKRRLRYWVFFGLFTVTFVGTMVCVSSETNLKIITAFMSVACALWIALCLYNFLKLARQVLRYGAVLLIVLGVLGLHPLFLVIILLANDAKIQKRMAARQFSEQLSAKTDSELAAMAVNSKNLKADELAAFKGEVEKRGTSYEVVLSAQAKAGAIAESTTSIETKAAPAVRLTWEVRSHDDEVKTYATQKEVEDAIMRDEIKPQWECRQVRVDPKAAKKPEPKWKLVERSFAIYRPIRAHMWKGAGIGAAIGIVLWLGQNAVGAFILAARFKSAKAFGLGLGGLLLLLFFVNTLVPTFSEKARKSIAPVINGAFKLIFLVGILTAVNGGAGVFSGAFSAFSGYLVASVLGALLGGLPGMAIGTCAGLIRRPRLPMPPSGTREDTTCAISTGLLLPMVLFSSCFYLYVKFVFPWAQEAFTHVLQ